MSEAQPTLLALRGLTVRAPDRVLVDGVDVTVLEARVTALCGPSGSGKSLTARATMAVLDVHPGLTAGTLHYPALDASRDWFSGVAGGGAPRQAALLRDTAHLRGSYLSYSPQTASSALNPGRTIGRQMELAILRRITPAREPMGALIRDLLDEVGLAPYVAGSLPGELSGGMCQRAALAIAMASDPRVLIADEPETGLDPVLRRQVVELLVKVGKAHRCGILLISHHEDTVTRIADDVVRFAIPAGSA